MRCGRFLSVVGFSLLGCSIAPEPPAVPGVTWERHTIYIPNTTAESPRVTLRGERNLNVPYLVAGRDFRYHLVVQGKSTRHDFTIQCRQTDEAAALYRCEGDRLLTSFELGERCLRGSLRGEGGAWAIEPWYVENTYVGFLVREGPQLIAALDLDHQWEYRIWTDGRRTAEQLAQLDVLSYLLADAHSAQASGGYPFLCPELENRRRSPQ